MNELIALAQPGVLSDPTTHAEFLTFTLKDQWLNVEEINEALSQLPGIEKSIRQKDSNAGLSVTMAFLQTVGRSCFLMSPYRKSCIPSLPLPMAGERFLPRPVISS